MLNTLSSGGSQKVPGAVIVDLGIYSKNSSWQLFLSYLQSGKALRYTLSWYKVKNVVPFPREEFVATLCLAITARSRRLVCTFSTAIYTLSVVVSFSGMLVISLRAPETLVYLEGKSAELRINLPETENYPRCRHVGQGLYLQSCSSLIRKLIWWSICTVSNST